MKKPTKAPPALVKRMVNYRFQESTIEALAKAARDDERNISSMAEKIVRDWLRANGYLK